MSNIAYIDGQNLYMATRTEPDPWHLDMSRFRVYLRDKYKVDTAYLFMGAYMQKHSDLYLSLQRSGYILIYREHSENLIGSKKGNVDVDIVFQVMRDLLEEVPFDKVVLVSGDGDYKRLVDYLIQRGRFERILLPNRQYASSLYKLLGDGQYAYIDSEGMRKKLAYRKA